MAGALHPIGGRSGPDTVGLLTFLTLERLPRARQMICPSDRVHRPTKPKVRRSPHANADRELVLQFVASGEVFLELA